MDLQLRGSRALITGGSRGIGFACAMQLALEGCEVALVSRSVADLEKAADELERANGARPAVYALDLAKESEREKLGPCLRSCDILINNAGAIPGGGFEVVDSRSWRDAWDLKVFGYIEATRVALNGMVERGAGAIVNVIGMAASQPRYDYLCGSTGNAALVSFTKAAGGFASRHGVRVLGINPGPTETDRLVGLYKARAQAVLRDSERWPELLAEVPFGRLPTAEDIGRIVAFLASPCATYLSGAVIDADGGAAYR